MRIVFLGNDQWSVASLAALASSSHHLVAAVTEPPKPAGRGHGLRQTPVAVAAGEIGVPLIEHGAGPLTSVLPEMEPDVLAVVAYGRILPQVVLDIPSVAPVNLHFSLLPDLRGASPVQSAILRGDRVTGVTIIRMVAALDAGPIYSQRRVDIGDGEDAGSLGARLAAIGAEELVRTIDALAAGSAVATEQDPARVTTCGKFATSDRRLLWEAEDAAGSAARVRAFSPEPGATTYFRGSPMRVLAARAEDAHAATGVAPGSIVSVDREGIVVAASRGTLRLLEVVPSGRARMSAAAFAAGARPQVGERFE